MTAADAFAAALGPGRGLRGPSARARRAQDTIGAFTRRPGTFERQPAEQQLVDALCDQHGRDPSAWPPDARGLITGDTDAHLRIRRSPVGLRDHPAIDHLGPSALTDLLRRLDHPDVRFAAAVLGALVGRPQYLDEARFAGSRGGLPRRLSLDEAQRRFENAMSLCAADPKNAERISALRRLRGAA